MTHVLVLDNYNEDLFFCGSCKKGYNSLALFIAHKNTDNCESESNVNSTELFNAVDATISSNTSRTQASEQSNNNEENKSSEISCQLCKKKFKKIRTLQIHLKMHDQKPYQCVICGRCFVQNSHLQRHILSHRVWPDGISKTTPKSIGMDLSSYSCIYCDLVLSNYNQFRAHLKNHSSVKKFKCIQDQCNNFYDSVESLMHHVSNTHQTLTYTCYNCKKVCNSLEEAAGHYQSYNNTCAPSSSHQLYKCSQCDAIFKKAEKLSLHMLTENHKKTCVHCNKTFSSDKRLRLHLQVHRKSKPYQCSICSQCFHMKKYLSSHMLKHGERQFTCMVCKWSFKRQDSLKRHMKLHQIRKVHTCPFKDTLECKKEFSRSDKLKSHLKFHTKRMNSSTITQTKFQKNSTGTVEICIVPLDKNKE